MRAKTTLISIISLAVFVSGALAGPPIIWGPTGSQLLQSKLCFPDHTCITSGGVVSAITQLTGDVTAGPGSGSVAATIPNAAFSGYSARFSQIVNTSNLADTLAFIMDMQYHAPVISLSATPAQSYRERGDNSITSVVLTAHDTQYTNPIQYTDFYNNAGTLIQHDTTTGTGNRVYTDSTTPPDGSIAAYQYTAKVYDGTALITSNAVVYPFVYPYYSGVAAPALDPTNVRSTLTHSIIPCTYPFSFTSSPTSQVFYLYFPATCANYTRVLDPNGFNITADFSQSTVSITGLDGNAISYRRWEYNNVTTQTSFTITFYP